MKPLHLRHFPADLYGRLEAAGAELKSRWGARLSPASLGLGWALRAELARRKNAPPARPVYFAASIDEGLLRQVRAALGPGESLSSFARDAARRLPE